MFQDFNNNQLELLYRGLKSLIETNSGLGLHNADGGHPVYIAGSQGNINQDQKYADSPETSTLFQMLSSLSEKLKKNGIESHSYRWWYDFSDWQKYCEFIIEAYKKN
ncbi:MAG: hypothetical protein VST71_00070 [Nitrospirota bacterium]|nr:hypothetical protein [Nitrospirota bacterium]